MIKVAICGVAGRMGQEVLKAVQNASDIELCAAVDVNYVGQDVGVLLGGEQIGVAISDNLDRALSVSGAQVLVDFTQPVYVMDNIKTALQAGVRPVVGTTGISEQDLQTVADMAADKRLGCIVAPNFAIGALLMIKFAQQAAKYFPHVEVIEKHHDRKLDAPSGTAIKTVEAILQNRADVQQGLAAEEEKIKGARGGTMSGGIRVHSVRLPGFVASQEVIFGDAGQTLTLQHDTISRDCFMPGVLVAVRAAMRLEKLVYGLENIIFE